MKRLVVNQYQLFCINVVLLVLADWMQSSRLFQNIPFVVIVFKYSALLFGILAFILEYKKGLNIKETAKLCFLILLSLLTCLKTRNMSYLLIVLIITIAKGVHVDDFIKINFKVSVVCAIIQISLWILNCFVNLGFPIYENAIERRIGFLYNHPNMAAVKLGWMIIMWLWLRWDIIQKKDYAIAAIAAGLLYYTTRSDGCILIYVFILLMILKSKPIIQKIALFCGKYSFFLVGTIAGYLSAHFIGYGKTSQISQYLDVYFSKRFAMAYLAIKNNGITLLGQIISTEHDREGIDTPFHFGNYTIDCLYIYLFVAVGVVWFVLISFGFYNLLKKSKSYKYAVVVIVFSLYAMIELHCLYPPKCFALLLLKNCIFEKEKSYDT